MPDVIIDKQIFYNPVDYALKKIGGTWKMPVLWRLKDRSLRYSELQNQIPHISQKMLTQALKQLEMDGFLLKKVYAEVPPRTEYALTEKGKKAITVIQFLREYGLELMTEAGIDYGELMKKESQKEK